jgi:hypothetical protein
MNGKQEDSEFGFKAKTGELCMLNKKERTLTREVLKRTLATAAGREFVVERFGKDGLKLATSLLEEMGVEVEKTTAQKPRTVS